MELREHGLEGRWLLEDNERRMKESDDKYARDVYWKEELRE